MNKLALRFAAIPALALAAMAQTTTGGTGAGTGTGTTGTGTSTTGTSTTGTSTGTMTTTGASTPFQLQTFNIERTQSLANVLTTATANIPSSVLTSIQGGALEVRERLIFNADQNTLTSTLFTVAPNSPNPTPASALGTVSPLATWTMNIDRVYQTNTPKPALMLVGTIATASSAGPFGSLVGAPVAVSIGYSIGTGSQVQVSNAVVLVAGLATLYSASAQGTVGVPPASNGSQGGSQGSLGSGNIQLTLAPREFVTSSKQMTISAAVNDPAGASGAPLTYQWQVMNGMAVSLDHADTPNLDVTFNQGKGDYTFQLTVTNALGQTANARITITYYGM